MSLIMWGSVLKIKIRNANHVIMITQEDKIYVN